MSTNSPLPVAPTAGLGSATSAALGERGANVPDWYPDWAREIADLYFAANTCVFLIHGNVNDLIYCPVQENGEKQPAFCDLSGFLSQQIFGSWDTVVSYDLGRGIQAEAGADAKRHQEMMKTLTASLGSPTSWSRDPDQVLNNLDNLVQRNLLEDDPAKRKRIAFLFPYAQYLVPAGENALMARGQAARLVRILSWAQNPFIKRVNMAFCLIAEAITEVNDRLVQNPHVATIEIPLPPDEIRRKFVEMQFAKSSLPSSKTTLTAGPSLASKMGPTSQKESMEVAASQVDEADSEAAISVVKALAVATKNPDSQTAGGLNLDALTQLSSGLNLINLNLALSRSSESQGVDLMRFRKLKKGLIERQCHDLVSFVEPDYTLDILVGHHAAKERLRQDALWIAEGRLDAAPMGYLICGPVGTGKTFLAECYAGTIGIPCLSLRNFRSKYVGESEGNLEKVLTVLRSLGPVVVIVDEADAALGNREMGGDSGTSSRVFSMIASQMGNTKFRGKIIWMLLTSRPELLPIDLKRQGRAEVHIPLFYPQETAEIAEMFRIMAKKNKVAVAEGAIPEVSPDRDLSGADIESIVLQAKRNMMAQQRNQMERSDLASALEAFIPSAQGLEKELQEMCAVLECTDRGFLTEKWRKVLLEPNGRGKLQKEVAALRELFDR